MKIKGFINIYRSGYYHRQGKPRAFDRHAGDIYMSEAAAQANIEPLSQHSSETPFKADPATIQRGQQLVFIPPLDEGIREAVEILAKNGIETYESCQGGEGHAYPEPTIRFEGDMSEGPKAVSIALAHGLRVASLRRAWAVSDKMLHGPWWEMTFYPSRPGRHSR